jgi:flavin reductase (DIM6/NTAB) family NADH-FMN oxidoreductase RutF
MIIDMDAHSGLKAYQWLASTVVPRPVAWVSTLSSQGQGNLAPFSFFQVLTGTPPTVMISPLLGFEALGHRLGHGRAATAEVAQAAQARSACSWGCQTGP